MGSRKSEVRTAVAGDILCFIMILFWWTVGVGVAGAIIANQASF